MTSLFTKLYDHDRYAPRTVTLVRDESPFHHSIVVQPPKRDGSQLIEVHEGSEFALRIPSDSSLRGMIEACAHRQDMDGIITLLRRHATSLGGPLPIPCPWEEAFNDRS